MIIYRQKPFNCKMKNIIVLDTSVGGCIYVSKETYEQALSIAITFSKDKNRVEKALGKMADGWMIIPGMYTAYNKVFDLLPKPLNMLAIFIALSMDSGIDWKIEGEELLETTCGVLHTISQFADFYSILITPNDARQKLEIPKHVYQGYHDSWESLTGTLEDNVVAVSTDEVNKIVVDCVGNTIESKVKEALANVELPTPSQAEVDMIQIESIVERMVTEKISTFVNLELPKIMSQQMQNNMMPNFQQMPQMYQMPGMYQMPQMQQPMMQPIVQPTQQPTPIVQPTLVQQPVPTAQPIQEEVEEVIVTDNGEEISMSDIEALYKEIEEKDSSDFVKKEDYNFSESKPVNTEPKILTEDVKKEKAIAEESIKIIQSYDI